MFGRILAAGLILATTAVSSGCYYHPFLCCHHPRLCGGCGGCGGPEPAGCGCAAFYPPPGPIHPIPAPGPVAIPQADGLGYAPMPTAAPPMAQARGAVR
jgi:hypothetical protein